jgi:hypothetical protein
MTTLDDKPPTQSHDHGGGHGGHSWMMIACCIPMLVSAVLLVATLWSSGPKARTAP